jgi:hypothetical protein
VPQERCQQSREKTGGSGRAAADFANNRGLWSVAKVTVEGKCFEPKAEGYQMCKGQKLLQSQSAVRVGDVENETPKAHSPEAQWVSPQRAPLTYHRTLIILAGKVGVMEQFRLATAGSGIKPHAGRVIPAQFPNHAGFPNF